MNWRLTKLLKNPVNHLVPAVPAGQRKPEVHLHSAATHDVMLETLSLPAGFSCESDFSPRCDSGVGVRGILLTPRIVLMGRATIYRGTLRLIDLLEHISTLGSQEIRDDVINRSEVPV